MPGREEALPPDGRAQGAFRQVSRRQPRRDRRLTAGQALPRGRSPARGRIGQAWPFWELRPQECRLTALARTGLPTGPGLPTLQVVPSSHICRGDKASEPEQPRPEVSSRSPEPVSPPHRPSDSAVGQVQAAEGREGARRPAPPHGGHCRSWKEAWQAQLGDKKEQAQDGPGGEAGSWPTARRT